MTSAINYNYSELSGMVSDLNRAAGNIEQQVQELVAKTRSTCGEFFTGTSADNYYQLAQQIGGDLTNNSQQMATIARSVNAGTSNMQNSDRNQAKRFQ
jgi:WXG100 family type VII secretion target